MAPSPCTCSSTSIRCDRKQLTHVPVFSRFNEKQKNNIHLNLDHNNLTSIPSYAFQNLSTINTARFYVDLHQNDIINIESHAFSGIARSVIFLHLANNKLTHLPFALEQLSSLKYFFLLDNPLINLDATIISRISSELIWFSISMGNFSRFPTELNGLTKLSSLVIHDIPFRFIRILYGVLF